MARETVQQVPEQASTLAEDITPRATPGVPTPRDYEVEWGRYRATTDLIVAGSLAVAAGNPVPASHPYLRDSDDLGPGWVSQGAVALVEGQEAPADLQAAHDAYAAAQKQAGPGPGMYPGA